MEELENKEEITPRSADFSGETQRYPMDGNSNCTAWCRWETYRAYRDGQPGWDCRFIINATKTNSYPTYGQGSLQAGVKGHEEGTLEEKYIEIVAGETRTFYDQAVFVRAEAGADVNMIAYANILVPNVVSKGMEFTISVKRNLWYVTYNANGGTGAPSTQKKHFNNALYLSTQKPTRSGYTFKGWSTSSSSSYAQYQPGDSFTTDADTTLYAVWSQNITKTWSITYNANGGSNAPAKQTANIGQSIIITSSKPTRTGYTFLGWSTWNESPHPEAAFTPGYPYISEYDITLYAVWQKEQSTQYCTITFHANGGAGAPASQQKVVGEPTYIPYAKPTRSGYTFLGWSTSRYATSADYQPGQAYTPYGNMTFYAVWRKKGNPKFIFSESYDCMPYSIGAVEELVMNATVENPENQKIYYKICFVDDADGTVNDYATNSGGLTNMIETGITSATLTVTPDILIRSIKNCNSEKSFKIVICSNYDNNFELSNTTINKQIISIRLYYRKPVIRSLEVSHAPYNGAQLVGIVKFSDGFKNIASRGNGESVYLDNKLVEHGEDYNSDNRFDVVDGNVLRYVFNFKANKISNTNHTFKLAIDDGFFKVEKTVDLGVLSTDENIYIYPDGTVEANGFLLLNSFEYDNEDFILFEPGGFVSAKKFKKISEGIYLCPKVFELFGQGHHS